MPRFRFDTVEHVQAYAKLIDPLVDFDTFWRVAGTAERDTPVGLVGHHERIAWQVRRAVEIAALERMTK